MSEQLQPYWPTQPTNYSIRPPVTADRLSVVGNLETTSGNQHQ